MIKANFKELKTIFNKYHFLGILILIFFGTIMGSMIVGIIPTILILIYLTFEKYIIKNKKFKEYNFFDLILNALFFGTIIGGIIMILSMYIY